MVAEPLERKKTNPQFRPGDTVRVHIKVVEGESERIQVFEGTVISRRGRGDSESFTVRKISFGVGVERTFPVISPHIDRIEVVKTGRARRSRLYYLRALSGKAARLSEEESQPSREPAAGQPPSAAPGGAQAQKPATAAAGPDGSAAAKPAQDPKKKSDSAPQGQARALGAAQ